MESEKNTEVREKDSLNNLLLSERSSNSSFIDGSIDNNSGSEKELQSIKGSVNDRPCFHEREAMLFREELHKHSHIISQGALKQYEENQINNRLTNKKSIWKNFIALCTGLLFAFTSFMPLRNIQTSLYSMHHLANISLAAMYFSFAIGCSVSSWLAQNARPKGIILVALFGHVMYTATNIYPSMMTLVPASCLFGFFHAPLWSMQELLIASYGAAYSALSSIPIEKSIQQFQGVFLIFCHAAQIFGNLLESAILHMGSDYHTNKTDIDPIHTGYYHLEIYNISDAPKDLIWLGPFGYRVEPEIEYPNEKVDYVGVVKFVFLILAALGMTVICLFFNKPDIIVQKRKCAFREKMHEMGCFLRSKVFVFLGLLMLFSGMQQAVVICNVTKMYGTLTLGLHMVGYMMMCYGTCQLVILLVVEKLQSRLKPTVTILNAFIITLGLLVLLYVWEPTPNTLFRILGYVGLWGAVDGLWQTQLQCILVSSVGRKESAVVTFRILQSIGLVTVFLLDIWLSLLTQICIIGAVLVFGVIMYMILEVIQNPMISNEPFPFQV
ncbi:hypothetical protein CHS0354_004145 [Potamilus streckersoni]|uniref:Uncharacterized protein n=1 Tax=Potamilus streckersoni TaxID=2493646 RepID=A0AAE0SZG0_9BIVA|nr:hypothetical protein CHS0354_004145 [Potamilus streckersoni]